MTGTDPRDREISALRERLSRLCEASLRVSESLDLDTVLNEVIDGARGLTGARYGGIALLDPSEQLLDFVTSGLTPKERRGLLEVAGGRAISRFFRTHPKPVRLSDFRAHVSTLGVTGELMPIGTFLGVPIRHRDVLLGNFYLSDKEGGGPFTDEDEETLVMFASQAAAAIANARRHRDEQRSRANLEALIDTSPVGVLVFDARTGSLVSCNREAARIARSLHEPTRPMEELLGVMTVRRADGREIPLKELSMAQALSAGETVRVEEIVLQVPGGRPVTVLLNATPIRLEEDEVESFVVTLQDMTPLEELERLRAEFLGLVSHELRRPLTSIRGSASTLLEASPDLDPAEMRQFCRIIVEQADTMREMVGDFLDVAHIKSGTLAVTPEPAEVAGLVDRARNTFLSGGGRNTLDIDLEPDLPPVRADRRRIVQVLGNLLSNAARHSPETSVIRVTAEREDLHVAVAVADHGRGISAERLPLLFGRFSRGAGEDEHPQIGGSGLGLAICKGIVEAHGGRIRAESDGPGLGARFTFTLPVVEEAAPPSPRTSRRAGREGTRGARILVVDDDPQTLQYVRDGLSRANFQPLVSADPEQALQLMREQKPHLVLLDLVLPGADGIELMGDLRSLADVPVIFLSGYGRDEVIARAFEAGAADYIVKPFSPTELVARIRGALRRREAAWTEPADPYVRAALTVDYAERLVTLAGRPVRLTAAEYDLLYELSVSAGRVVTHDQLLRRIWGAGHSGDVRLIRALVRRLRRKLGDDAGRPTYIFSEPRVGYRMPRPREPGRTTE